MTEASELLQASAAGDSRSTERLLQLVYGELRRLAAQYLAKERSGHTLQPTALVHEAYLRLVQQDGVDWKSQSHFMGVAGQIMRRILVDHARRRLADKRGGRIPKLELNEIVLAPDRKPSECVAVDEALTRLERLDPRQAKVVELRFFGGLTVEETAAALGVSPKTVKRDWTVARAWLHSEMHA